MKLYKTKQGIVVENDNDFFLLRNAASDFFFNYNLNVNIYFLLEAGRNYGLTCYLLRSNVGRKGKAKMLAVVIFMIDQVYEKTSTKYSLLNQD